MKRKTFVVPLLVLCCISMIQAQNAAPKPDPETEKLHVFVGHWRGEGETKPLPQHPTAQKLVFEETNEMILGGFFLEVRDSGMMGLQLYIIGYDPAKKTYPVAWYTDAGTTTFGTMTCEGNTWILTWSSESGGKPHQGKFTMNVAPDGMSHTDKQEASSDGTTWITVYEGKLTKVSSEAKK